MIITTIEPEVGGPSYVVVNAIAAERAAGLLTDLASTVPSAGPVESNLRTRLAATGARHHEFARPRHAAELTKRWGVSPGLGWWLLRHARRYDVLHAHYVWSFGTVAALVAGFVWRVPVVLTPHESLTEFGITTSRTAFRRRQKLWVKRALLRRIRTVLLSSDLERLDSVVEGAPVEVVAHPVPSGTVARHLPAASADAGFVVGYLGRLHEKKRVEVLITALAELPDAFRLQVGGDEPRENLAAMQELARRLGIESRVGFVGFVDEADRDGFFASVDVMVMPSAYECFGMVAAEAMTAGLPVIVSRRTGVATVVETHAAGIVVDSGEPSEVARSLRRLAENPAAREEMGERARSAAAASFSYAAYAARTSAIYGRVG